MIETCVEDVSRDVLCVECQTVTKIDWLKTNILVALSHLFQLLILLLFVAKALVSRIDLRQQS